MIKTSFYNHKNTLVITIVSTFVIISLSQNKLCYRVHVQVELLTNCQNQKLQDMKSQQKMQTKIDLTVYSQLKTTQHLLKNR